jgi:hypothetical protein
LEYIMKTLITLISIVFLLAACTTANDVAIQTAHANARAQECTAVATIAQSGAASEAAVLMAARGCGAGPAPSTGADRVAGLIGAVAPIAGALINGAVSLEAASIAAGTQSESIAAGTARAQIDANVLTTLGQDQVVTVRPQIVTPTVVDPVVIQTPAPDVIQLPAPETKICSNDSEGNLVCQ